jgi:hypothetical protein
MRVVTTLTIIAISSFLVLKSDASPQADSQILFPNDTVEVTGLIHTAGSSPESYWFILTGSDSTKFPFGLDSLSLFIASKDAAAFPVDPRCFYSAGKVRARGVLRMVANMAQMEICRPDQIAAGNSDLPICSGPPIAWEEAFKYIGQTKVVEGPIAAVRDSVRGCVLILRERKGRTFEVYLVAIDISNFRRLGRGPTEYYPGKFVRATGIIIDTGRLIMMKVDDNCMIREINR